MLSTDRMSLTFRRLKQAAVVTVLGVGVALVVGCGVKSVDSQGASHTGGGSPVPQGELGTMDGGGGSAVVCRSADSTLKSVQVLDLFEAGILAEGPIPPSLGTLNEEWQKAVTHFASRSSSEGEISPRQVDLDSLNIFWVKFNQRIKLVDSGLRLKSIDDAKPLFTLPAGCSMEQVINYQDVGDFILIQKDLWNLMSPRDQAALVMHEYIYKFYRSFGAKDSVVARKVVRRIFAEAPLAELVPPKSVVKPDYLCSTNGQMHSTSLTVMQTEVPNTPPLVFFTALSNHVLVDQTAFTLPRRVDPREMLKEMNCKALKAGKALVRRATYDVLLNNSYIEEKLNLEVAVTCRKSGLQSVEMKLKRSGLKAVERLICGPAAKVRD